MQRPSTTWLEYTAVKIYALLLLIAYPSLILAQSDIDKARAAAQNDAASVYEYLGSGAAINQNAAQPIISSKTQMTTVDKSKRFSAQLQCPSTTKFVDIVVQPGSTGDLSMVLITQDTDLDGQMDYQFQVPFPVSGICGNGIIQCDAGTWGNCRYWKWVVNGQGQLSVQQTDITKMGGCYCVNNSCGNNIVWVSLPLILKDLGAGATGAIMSANPKYSLTDVKINDAEIAYYSQSLRECGTMNSGSGTNPANYFAGGQTDALITDATQQEVTTEQTDPDSMYNVMSNSIQYHNTLGQVAQCKLIRNVVITQETTCPAGESYSSIKDICTGPPVSVNPNQSSSYWFYNGAYRLYCSGSGMYLMANPGGSDRSWSIAGATCSGDVNGGADSACITYLEGSGNQLLVYAVPKDAGGCGGMPMYLGALTFTGATVSGSVSTQSCVLDDAWDSGLMFHDRCIWERWTSINISPLSDPPIKNDLISNSIDNQCSGLENNSLCSLQDEKVDNVFTYKNNAPTGLLPLSTCRDYSGFSIHNICSDWWEKDRTYFCQNNKNFDFTESMKRVSSIYKTTDEINGVATFTDYRKDEKTQIWTTEGNTFDLGVARNQPYDTCSKVCKTRKQKQDSQATQSGVTFQYRKDITTYEFYYRQCYPNPTVCPAGVGEEILKDCQCIDEFAETFSLIEALKEAGQDAICSSGIKK